MEDLRVLVLFYMIEGAIVGYVGMALIGVKLNLKQFLSVGILQGSVVYLVRGIYNINHFNMGTHTFFNLIGLVIILYLVSRKRFGICLIGSMLGFLTVIVSEVLTIPALYSSLKVTLEKVWADAWIHIALGYVGDWLLILVAVILAFTGKSLISVQNDEFEGTDLYEP